MGSAPSAAPPGAFSGRIAVDQFGYMPEMPKVAVISDPRAGYNSAESYAPGATLEVRTWGDHRVVFVGAPASWNGGATQGQSGDRVWWFDFSSVTAWGEYYVYDPSTDARSARFRIDHRVYEEVLKHAVRGATNQYLTVQFTRQLGETRLAYVFEGTSDFVDWLPLCTAQGAGPPQGPGFVSETGTGYQRTVVARDHFEPHLPPATRFVRLRLLWQ
jgi:hypothetical protein